MSPSTSLAGSCVCKVRTDKRQTIGRVSPITLLGVGRALSLLDFRLQVAPRTRNYFLLRTVRVKGGTNNATLYFGNGVGVGAKGVNKYTKAGTSAQLGLGAPHVLGGVPSRPRRLVMVPASHVEASKSIRILFAVGRAAFGCGVPTGAG